jgi:splicing factor 3B subunit 4
MLQAGRIVNVHLPKDRVTQTHQGYGFVEFISEEDAEYAARIMNQVRLYGKPIRVNKASADKQKTVEVGAELFVGNLDPMVTEQVLYETFSRFGSLVAAPKVCQTTLLLYCYIFTRARSLETTTTSPKATGSYPFPTSKPPMMRLPT